MIKDTGLPCLLLSEADEIHIQAIKKADNGNRTRLSSLGSWRSTDELYLLKNQLYYSTFQKTVNKKVLTHLYDYVIVLIE